MDKKFAKASVLFAKLLEEQCSTSPTDERIKLLMQTIQDVMDVKKERIHHADVRNDFAALFRVVDKYVLSTSTSCHPFQIGIVMLCSEHLNLSAT